MTARLCPPGSLLILVLSVGVGCTPPVEPIFGDGSHSLESVTLTVIADSGDDLDVPRDIAFHPDRTDELWVVNQGDESVAVLFDAGTDDQEAERFHGPESAHFLAQPASLAFSDNGNFATTHETDDTTPFTADAPGTFMGPTLWTSDLDVFDGSHAGHIDMLHNSPNGMGVAWDNDNTFWVFDGYHESITRYEFNADHGPGGTDHADGEVERYVEGEVDRASGVPSHMELDHDTGLLYIADTDNGRIAVLDTESGSEGDDISPNYDFSDQVEIEDAEIWTLVDGDTLVDSDGGDVELRKPSGLALHEGLLYITDNRGGLLFAFSLEGELLDWIDLERDSGGLMGIAFDESGQLYLTDAEEDEILRLDPLEE